MILTCKKLRHTADNQFFLEIFKEEKNITCDSIIHFGVKCCSSGLRKKKPLKINKDPESCPTYEHR